MKKSAFFFIMTAGVLWGSMGLFVRRLNAMGLSSMEIVGLRACVTAALLLLFLLIFDRKLFRIRLRDAWCFLGTGICSIVFFNACYFRAIVLTSLSVAAILLYTAPAIVMVLSALLFGEKLTRRKSLSLGLTFAGCVLVTGIGKEMGVISMQGILAGLGAGAGYAFYSIFGRYALQRGYRSLTITFYTFLIAATWTFVFSDMRKVAQIAAGSGKQMLFCMAFGLVCTVLPYLSYTLGLQYMENGKASVVASIEPVTAALLGAVYFGETLTVSGVAGIVLVLAGIVFGREGINEKTKE